LHAKLHELSRKLQGKIHSDESP